LASIVVIDREPKYFSSGGVSYAVSHDSAIVYALPEFHPPTQHVGGKRSVLRREGTQMQRIGVGQLIWAKLKLHRRLRTDLSGRESQRLQCRAYVPGKNVSDFIDRMFGNAAKHTAQMAFSSAAAVWAAIRAAARSIVRRRVMRLIAGVPMAGQAS
jgi:hypothetical protein